MIFRKATKNDVPQIVKLLVTDKLGKLRENYNNPLPTYYYNAFDFINKDVNQELMVVENQEDPKILASFQLTFIPYLSYRGSLRAQIENVMVREDLRGQGIGKQIFEWAIIRAKERKAHVLQLTSDKLRPRAIKFYKNLGFVATHEGMKLHFK
ncbi:ribosomal protein S18 acetylase RimI-like enzyme [Lutibacter oceani]|uniref:Ribosomal protein S18 acetylase RimI-like enzyme n=1 Tax=Lutibacter oceani TaxID=1853311 RepID=A0A3D9RSX1_9FLAO|nr:GNAT family N-acetyltransferase [Lutibacter oceani]REE79805.1 ribosomal protein S18 acetylase RimI-like enzyme [Lutibacter oceani]